MFIYYLHNFRFVVDFITPYLSLEYREILQTLSNGNRLRRKASAASAGPADSVSDGRSGSISVDQGIQHLSGHIACRARAAAALLHHYGEGVGEVLIPQEAGKPGTGLLAASHLSSARFGAEIHIGEAVRAVGQHHILGHHVGQHLGGIRLDQPAGAAGDVGGGQGEAALGFQHQIGDCGLPAVGHTAHPDHQGTGVDQVVVLAHAGPAQLGGGGTLQRYAAGGGGDAADGVAVQQTGLLCVLGDGLRAQFVGQLGE